MVLGWPTLSPGGFRLQGLERTPIEYYKSRPACAATPARGPGILPADPIKLKTPRVRLERRACGVARTLLSMAQVEITTMTFGPFGVGRLDGKAVMVPNAAPGDLLEITVVQERAGYLVARADRVLKAGAARRTPPCPYLPRCGGCDWQQITYPAQAGFKAEIIA